MNDDELKFKFPFGATLIQRGVPDPITWDGVKVGDSFEESDPDFFTVWLSQNRDLYLSRKMTPLNDGYVTKSSAGDKYFLRPLPKDRKPDWY
jgi:hypothetical protein